MKQQGNLKFFTKENRIPTCRSSGQTGVALAQHPSIGRETILARVFLRLIISDNINDTIIYSCLGLERFQGARYLLDPHVNPVKSAEAGESLR